MNTSSAKAKGRRLQQETVDIILEYFPELTEKDVRSIPMGTQGSDVWLSPVASERFPFDIECKNQERLNIWGSLEQAKQDNRDEGKYPLLVFSRNYTPTYVAMELEDFMELMKR